MPTRHINTRNYVIPATVSIVLTLAITLTLSLVFAAMSQDKHADYAVEPFILEENNSTDPLESFRGWPDTSMYEFLVIHESVLHAFRTADTQQLFDIDEHRKIGAKAGELWAYFDVSTTERTQRMEVVGSMLGIPLTLDEYNEIRDYFNRIVPP